VQMPERDYTPVLEDLTSIHPRNGKSPIHKLILRT
jgi:hypothetical protein